jgi:hypothetical protein
LLEAGGRLVVADAKVPMDNIGPNADLDLCPGFNLRVVADGDCSSNDLAQAIRSSM